MSLEEFPSLLFWSKLQNNQYQLFFEYLVEFTSEATGPGYWNVLLVGMFLITDSTSLLVIGLFRFCIGLWLNLGRQIPSVVFLGMCSFKLGYPIIVHSTLLILFISVELVVMLLLSYLILIFWVVSLFFIVHLTKDLLILLIFICCWSFVSLL